MVSSIRAVWCLVIDMQEGQAYRLASKAMQLPEHVVKGASDQH